MNPAVSVRSPFVQPTILCQDYWNHEVLLSGKKEMKRKERKKQTNKQKEK
jgi:hypothetical protein